MKPYRIEIIEPVSQEKLQKLNNIINKEHGSRNLKLSNIRNTFGTLCNFCRSERFDYPARKVVFQLDGIQVIETYCLSCFEKAGYKDTDAATTVYKPKPKPKPKQKPRKRKRVNK